VGPAAFRAKQLYGWLHEKQVLSFEEMRNLPAPLRETLTERCYITALKVKRELRSELDSTIKYLYELPDGNCVESVVMEYKHGTSVCISTQVGCRMGCTFCASTLRGLTRGLTPSEMLDEIYAVRRYAGKPAESVVLMGIGEPLDNYENVLTFLKMLSSPEGMNLSLRHLSLSTCGLAEQIDRLAEEKLGSPSRFRYTPTDELRTKTMPVNRAYD
jgi:23S rRNA (adenine2503-C2)-methyltransferase